MDLTRHCSLCDNQKRSLKIGTTCALNDRKPEFNKTCPKIELNEKFENMLKLVNIEYENFKRKKILTYTYFGFFLIIGTSVIVGGYLFGKYVFDHGVISTFPIIIITIGLSLLGMAFGTLNKHRQDINIAKSKKDRIDEVLNEYRIEYNIDILFGKEIHGTQDVSVNLKTKGIR